MIDPQTPQISQSGDLLPVAVKTFREIMAIEEEIGEPNSSRAILVSLTGLYDVLIASGIDLSFYENRMNYAKQQKIH